MPVDELERRQLIAERLTLKYLEGGLPLDQYRLLFDINTPKFDLEALIHRGGKTKPQRGMSLLAEGFCELFEL